MVLALGRIETEMVIHTAEKPEGNPPAESAESAEVAENAEPKKRKAIGNFAGDGKVVSYAIDDRFAITVMAKHLDSGLAMWEFRGSKDGLCVINGYINGGKWAAMNLCKFIRNGIVSLADRLKRRHAKRREKAASAPAGAPSDAAEPTNRQQLTTNN